MTDRPDAASERPAGLRRSPDNRMIAGVAGGIGEFLGVDPAVVRLAFVLLTIFGGTGVLLYALAWLVMPRRSGPAPDPPSRPRSQGDDRMIFGAILVIVGAVWLVNSLLPGYDRLFWPALLIGIGAGVIAYALRR